MHKYYKSKKLYLCLFALCSVSFSFITAVRDDWRSQKSLHCLKDHRAKFMQVTHIVFDSSFQ